MGKNFTMTGFTNVEDMVTAMCGTEDAQLFAFSAFLKSSKLDTALRAHDWTSLARGYNGPKFAENQYDTKLGAAFQKYSTGALPDITARAAQLYLTYAGFNPGPVMVYRVLKRGCLAGIPAKNGLPATGTATRPL